MYRGEVMDCCRKKERTEEEKKLLLNRIKRIEGQVRGIGRMIEEDSYCADIITQITAANAALDALNREILSKHIKTCVENDIKAGKDETVDELLDILKKLMR